MEPGEGSPFGIPALTADGQLITAQVNLTLSVVPDGAELLLRLLRGRGAISASDVARSIKDELLAKVIALELSKHSAEELRVSEELLRSVYESVRVQLDSTLSGYGLRLANFSINWGLSHDEREQIEEQRHEARLRVAQRRVELEEIRASGPQPPEPAAKTPDRIFVSGIPLPWALLLVVVVAASILGGVFGIAFLMTRDRGAPAPILIEVPPDSTAPSGGAPESPTPAPTPAIEAIAPSPRPIVPSTPTPSSEPTFHSHTEL